MATGRWQPGVQVHAAKVTAALRERQKDHELGSRVHILQHRAPVSGSVIWASATWHLMHFPCTSWSLARASAAAPGANVRAQVRQ